jgi:hypothetical protein
MKMIKWVSDIMEGNLREAEKYIGKAYELRDIDREAADWCREMAAKHLGFNERGHELVKNLIHEYRESGKHSELAPGMQAVYNDIHADMIRRNSEIMAMIQMYK